MLIAGLVTMQKAGTTLLADDVPKEFTPGGLGAILKSGRSIGLTAGVVAGIVAGLLSGLIVAVALGLGLAVVVGLVFGLGTALIMGFSGFSNGLGAWVFHYWLRRRMAARGSTPLRLVAFLQWCAEPERGWVRISDAAEFRHREFQDYLVRTPVEPGPGSRGAASD